MKDGFACLVIADESPEFPAALAYGSLLAKATGWRLIMLRVIEPAEPAPWAVVSEEMRRQAMSHAESLTQRFAAEVWAECGIEAERIIRQGELKPEVRRFIEEEPAVNVVVLAAAGGNRGPGPLVASLAKAQGLGGRAVPVMVVPGVLSKAEIRALALPLGEAAAPPSA
jgi:Universal stress protein family